MRTQQVRLSLTARLPSGGYGTMAARWEPGSPRRALGESLVARRGFCLAAPRLTRGDHPSRLEARELVGSLIELGTVVAEDVKGGHAEVALDRGVQ